MILLEWRKTLHDNFLGLRDKQLDYAIKTRQRIMIKFPDGQYGLIENPKEWKKKAQKVKKKYLYDEPMVLYENYVTIIDKEAFDRTEKERQEKMAFQRLMMTQG